MSEPPAADVLVAHDPRSRRSAEVLASSIDRAGLRVQAIDQRSFQALGADPLAILEPVRALVVAVGAPSVDDFLFQLSRASHAVHRPLFVALLNGAEVSVPETLGVSGSSGVFDFRSGINEDLLASLLEQLRMASGVVPDEFEISKRAPEQQVHLESNAQVSGDESAPPDRGPATAAEAWRRFDDSALEAMGQAYQIARDHRAQGIHTEDMLVGLFRERDGPTAKLLEDAGITEADLAGIVSKEHPTIRIAGDGRPVTWQRTPPRLSRHVSDALRHALEAVDESSRINSRELLYGLVALESCSVAKALRDARITPDRVLAWRRTEPAGPLAIPEALAGFQSDSTGGPDLLNIGPEVDAIATVLAARKVDPPLALGLFGDWGTGKTFFMDELEKRIALLASREAAADRHGDARVYCRNIVQLRFNAWHYIDVDLWASLANAIFEGLDDAMANQQFNSKVIEGRGRQRAGLLLKRAKAETDLEEKRQEQAEADRLAAEAQAEVERVEGKYDELVDAVRPEVILASGLKVAVEQPEVAARIKEEKAKVSAAVKDVAEQLKVKPEILEAELAGGSTSGYVAVWKALLQDKAWRIWVPIAALAGFAVVVALGLDALGFDSAALVGAGVSLLVGVAAGLRPLLEAGGRVSRVMADARAEAQRLVKEERDKEREKARAKKEKLDQGARDAADAVLKKEAALSAIDDDLGKLRPGRQMADFVRVRQSSNEYKSRLGVVARARDDFEELSRLLAIDKDDEALPDGVKAAGDETADAAGPKAIERIILYIDDLDRCKEKEVVAVLQAVHLLLAFPLFVVIVAVDPRWLLHSLRVESGVFAAKQEGLSDDDEDGLGWEATPLNYLEKIFQIPFALRPMGETGFGKIINNLVGYDERAGEAIHTNGRSGSATVQSVSEVQSATESGNGAGRRPEASAVATERDGNAPQAEETAESVDAEPAGPGPDEGATQDDAETRPVEMNPRSLDISDGERRYMAHMYPLIGTPRGAKRFVNVYRLLKASHPVTEQGSFAKPGVHRPVLLLLAALTGYPRETAEILRILVEDEPGGTWWNFVLPYAEQAAKATKEEDPLRSASWEQLTAKLQQVQSADERDLSCDDMRVRAREVARYSFESSRILFLEAEDTKAQAAKTRSPKPRAAKATATKNPVRSKAGSGRAG